MEEFDDYEVDDIFDNDVKRKKKNSKNKGGRGELALVKILNKRFDSQEFSRVSGSGNRWSQVQFVKRDYIGDIVSPDNFKFVIECKFGYDDIDVYRVVTEGHSQIDSFLKQAKDDAKRADRTPLLCWKRTRRPWLAFFRPKDINIEVKQYDFDKGIWYGQWWGIDLELFLSKLPNEVFFDD